MGGDEQFLSMTKLRLFTVQKQIESDRRKEIQLKLSNHSLRSEIADLKQQHDALREDIKSEEKRARSMTKSKQSNASSVKPDRRSEKSVDPKERRLVETALHIIKGALVKALEIPTARTTLSVHFSDSPFTGSITVGNCADGQLRKLDE